MESTADLRYDLFMTKEQLDLVFDNIRTWPDDDQAELIELAREIEARRTGVYVLSDDERAAIAKARKSRLLSEEESAAVLNKIGAE